MSRAANEAEAWRAPVLALRAMERALRARPGAFTNALAAETILERIAPDVSMLDAAPLSGLAGAAERAARPAEASEDGTRTKRARPAAGQMQGGSSAATAKTNRFATGSDLIGAALQRGRAIRALGEGSSDGGRSRKEMGRDASSLGKGAAALAGDAAVPLPLDPARRRGAFQQTSSSGTGSLPAAASTLGAAASAALEGLQRASGGDGAPGPPNDSRSSGSDTPAAAGFEAIRRVGRLADELIGTGAKMLQRRDDASGEALMRGASASPARASAQGEGALDQVDRLASGLLARTALVGAASGGAGAQHETAGQRVGPVAGPPPAAEVAPATGRISEGSGSAASTAKPHPAARASSSAAAAPLPDASTIATLVNDVLMEQARRHGVDLT